MDLSEYTYPKFVYIEAWKQQLKAAQKAVEESEHSRYHPQTLKSIIKATWIAGNSVFDEYNAWEKWYNKL